MVPHGQLLFRLAGPWSWIRPWLAMTLQSDTKLWAERGVNLRNVRSRVFIFSSAVNLDKLFSLSF
jgi:hypothetical protein